MNGNVISIKKTISGLKVGDIITYCYKNVNNSGWPISPKIERKRNDVSWEELQTKQT